jgi:peptidyl-tRNA hydrolase, PTH1 family
VRALVGLGNPGSEYEGTRHNIGFAVVDALSSLLKIRLSGRGRNYRLGEGAIGEERVLLLQPLTYMNNSGEAVREIVEAYRLELQSLLVIVDDFHLPLGAIRIRLKGSDGGHNGLYSIIEQLQSDNFPRLRCGIGGESMPSDNREMAHYVLSPFEKQEQDAVRDLTLRARDAAVVAVSEGFEAAVSRFNRTT